MAKQHQRICHDTLPWLISVSLDLSRMRESLQETYPEAWREFWKWRTLHWISWAVWIPAILLSLWTSLDIRSWLGLSLMLLLICFLSLTYGGLRGFIVRAATSDFS
jgi:hypothetical protein